MSGRVLIVVSSPEDLPEIPADRLITADRYLAGVEGVARGATVVNLCRSYRYRSKGYYTSLIADARGQQAVPTAEAIEGLSEPFGILRVLHEAGVPTVDGFEMRSRRKAAAAPASGNREPRPEADGDNEGEAIDLLAYFGVCSDPRGRAAAQAIYREWPTPVLRIQMVEEDEDWLVTRVVPVPMQQLEGPHRPALIEALNDEKRMHRRGAPNPRELKRASIAILYDEDDPFSPSTPETLERLEKVAARQNVYARRIGLDDLDRLGEYDALFIRTLTGVREPSFQFALRAEMLDMPVIDDPQSIIRCSNKVFLEELLRREEIPTPRTLVVTSHTDWKEVAALGSPVVVKLPDGSFSAAVHKCASEAEYERVTAEMFRRSPLLIAQEFLPTEFDWRVTVLDGRVLFAARYFMARGHWQIRAEQEGHERFGKVEAVKREEAPRAVKELALRAARLIGTGLYGVDLKETPRGPVVIEINDNPNLDIGYDDAADGGLIYEDIIRYFLRRIEETPGRPPVAEPDAPAEVSLTGTPRQPPRRHFRPFEVAGLEIEYAVVDRDLNVVSMVAPALRALAGRPTSDVDLGHVAFSNEIADHVFELKTPEPTRSLREAEHRLMEGVQRFSAVLREQFGARLLPTGMHPWVDPRKARLWSRSNTRIYGTYARLFDVQTHGWLNVQSTHLNLPMGRGEEAVAMMNAAALVIPYLPALAASSPMYDGELQDAADNRLAWILKHQARIPESQGWIVPEFAVSLADYRRSVLGPMYQALDALPDAGALRHEFFNARGAVFKFSRRALEIRVLDTQECVKLDVAIAVFVRSLLRGLTRSVRSSRQPMPPHALLVDDFRATIAHGSEARVWATHLANGVERDDEGKASVRDVLRILLERARRDARKDEAEYLDLAARIIETGSLSERIRAVLLPEADDDDAFTEAARHVYIELANCLEANEPWRGRGL